MQQNGVLINPGEINRKVCNNTAKNAGFNSRVHYQNCIARKLGYENNAKRRKEKKWNGGKCCPILENEDNRNYTGRIGEIISIPILNEYFGGIDKILSYNHPYYEYIVKGGYKIDVKTALLKRIGHSFDMALGFGICYNNVADYFLLLVLDSIENKNILHV